MFASSAVRVQKFLTGGRLKAAVAIAPRFMSKHSVESDEQFDQR